MGQIKNLTIILVILLSSMAYIGVAFAVEPDSAIDIDIKIAPATLNLEFKGPWITVHTDIPFSEVKTDTVELNEIPVFSTFADDRGNLVAKFKSADVKAIVVPSEAILTLTGETDVGGSFEGSDTIRVIDPPNK